MDQFLCKKERQELEEEVQYVTDQVLYIKRKISIRGGKYVLDQVFYQKER